MSLKLDKNQLSKILEREEFKIRITKSRLLEIFSKTYHRTVKIFNQIIDNYDKNGLEKSLNGEDINPVLWQCGHIVYFYKKHCFNFFNLQVTDDLEIYIKFYDSFLTKSKYRSNRNRLLDMYILLEEFEEVYKKITDGIINGINNDKYNQIYNDIYNKIETKKRYYVLLLSILHNEMHIEALIFSGYNLGYLLKDFISIRLNNISLRQKTNDTIKKIQFSHIKGGNFIQGTENKSLYLSFDNERPAFKKVIKDFSISKYPVTEHQFLQFILDGGYNDNTYWFEESWDWIQSNNIKCPLYWSIDNLLERDTNYPAMNISWYEAKAFCEWTGSRLPYESEWEYVATCCGKYNYPWGNEMKPEYCNLNYMVNSPLEVDDEILSFEKSYTGVKQLIGNVWEWCEEEIYPYDGFTIDPVYREMSYPFFGFKKICRGGCFAVPDYLINSRYRNAQMPDCRIQFTGFRICKKTNFFEKSLDQKPQETFGKSLDQKPKENNLTKSLISNKEKSLDKKPKENNLTKSLISNKEKSLDKKPKENNLTKSLISNKEKSLDKKSSETTKEVNLKEIRNKRREYITKYVDL